MRNQNYPKVKHLRIATRKSELAMIQTNEFIKSLKNYDETITYEIIGSESHGDIDKKSAIHTMNCSNIFVKMIENLLLVDKADVIVHSLKDVCTSVDPRFTLACFLPRENSNDCVIWADKHMGLLQKLKFSPELCRMNGWSLKNLPENSVIGTSSVRRAAFLKSNYPHLKFKPIRGNLMTRIEKLNTECLKYDAIVMAYAGWKRMKRLDVITEVLDKTILLPAASQGVIAAECLSNNQPLIKLLSEITCRESFITSYIERSILRDFDAGCTAAVAMNCQIKQSFSTHCYCLTIMASICNTLNFETHLRIQQFMMPIFQNICEKTDSESEKLIINKKIGMSTTEIKKVELEAIDHFLEAFFNELRDSDVKNLIEHIREVGRCFE